MKKARIFIVEDEALIVMELKDRLERLGHTVCGTAARGEDAAVVIPDSAPDLVLMDIKLSGAMDGIETARAVLERIDVPVVYLTAYSDEKVLERAAVRGPFGYLVKPVVERELVAAIAMALYRHSMEKRLRESETLYRRLFEGAGDAILILDTEGERAGRIVDANAAAAAMHGYAVDELRGMKIADLDTPAAAAEAPALIERMLRGEWLKKELDHRKKDGTVFPVEASAGLLELGERKYILAFDRDITERRRAESALKHMNRALRTLSRCNEKLVRARSEEELLKDVCSVIVNEGGYRLAWVGYAIQDKRKTVQVVNQCGCDEGYLEKIDITWAEDERGRGPTGTAIRTGKQALVRDTQQDLLFAPWRGGAAERGYRSVLALPLQNEQQVFGALTIYAAEPDAFDDDEMNLLRELADDLAYGIEMLRTREARKRAEEERERLISDLRAAMDAISRSQREWQHTFDTITDLIYITDSEFRVLRANRAFAAYCGREPRELIGRKCYELFHEDGVMPSSCPHADSMRAGSMIHREMADFRKDRIFLVTALPIAFAGRENASSLIIARDVTDARETEARLIMAERLATLGQMASGVAHEINNPLAAIAGCAEGLLNRVRKDRFDPEFFTKYLNIIEEEVVRCKTITTTMLSFVRKASYEYQMLDLKEVLQKTLEIVAIQGRTRSMEVVERYQENMPRVFGSAGELRQVFLALISNALDAMEEQGTLTVETSSDGKHGIIRISDTGPGIAPENLQRIFAPFFTTKSDKGGTGLGLSIARKIVNGHHGDITVSSETGKGTSFTIVLPLSQPV